MINSSELKDDSVEKLFCIPFEGLTQTPMVQEEAEIFVSLSLSEKSNTKKSLDLKAFPSQNYQILVSSLQSGRFEFEITEEAAIMVSVMCGSIGDVIMYMAYLQYQYFVHPSALDNKITMSRIAFIFPAGFPSSSELRRMWDLQKVGNRENGFASDNLLDYKECYKSIS